MIIKNLKITKYIYFVIGILTLCLGVVFAIQSNLGASPFDALLVGLHNKFGLTVGSWEIIISMLLIMCNSILKLEKPAILGLLTAVITGLGIDMWLLLLHNTLAPTLMYSKVICLAFGLIITGIGTAIYIQTNFAPMPIDKLMMVIKDLTHLNILVSRTIIYVLFLMAAIMLNGPIGIGTLLIVFLGGPILNFFMPLFKIKT